MRLFRFDQIRWRAPVERAEKQQQKASYRVGKTHRTYVCVWLAAVLVLAGAEGLGLRVELYVTLYANDGLESGLQQKLQVCR